MISQRLSQKLHLKLSPQQIILAKLLEVPSINLEQRIKKELEENPLLEEGNEDEEEVVTEENEEAEQKDEDEFDLGDYTNDEDIPPYKLSASNYSKDDEKKDIPYSGSMTFIEHLESQINLKFLSEKEKILAKYLIGNFDEAGWLRREIEAIVDDLAFSQNISTTDEELEKVLLIIQELDPAGVGARDLQECLLLQIERKETKSDAVVLATKILKNYFDAFSKKHYEKIISSEEINENQLKEALTEILKLNPKPGGSVDTGSDKSVQQITPDFILSYEDGEFNLSLNQRNAPELKINRTYAEIINTYKENKGKNTKKQQEDIMFIKQKLDSAKGFIDAIKQRQHTLLSTMNSILDFQEKYFMEGDETALKPMILKDIAERTNLDISTISRVANGKYIQTHFGTFQLKYFFSEGLQTESGEDASSREIKRILQDLIDAEDKKKPLTDEKLSKLLQEKGYQIARRTVAKYRDVLNIPIGRLRKELT